MGEKGGPLNTETQGDSRVKMEAEIVVIYL